eukprot:SAG11_NODE_2660_length_3120_cov_1.337968_1_plen_354_part_01
MSKPASSDESRVSVETRGLDWRESIPLPLTEAKTKDAMADEGAQEALTARIQEINQQNEVDRKQMADDHAAAMQAEREISMAKYAELEASEGARYDQLKESSDSEIARIKAELQATLAKTKADAEAAAVLAEDKLNALRRDHESKMADMSAQVADANASDGKTQDSMKELGVLISSAAKDAPSLLRAAKESLDEKQVKIDDLEAQYKDMKDQYDVYKKYYDGIDETSAELEEEKSKTASLEADIAEHLKTINSLEGQVETLTRDLETVGESKALAESEKDDISAKLDETTDNGETKAAQLQAEIDGHLETIASLEQEIADQKEAAETATVEFVENITAARKELSDKLAAEVARA